MFGNLEIFTMAGRSASHAGTRQSIVAENIAHADTPGFKAKDIPTFTELWGDRDITFQGRATRPGHLMGSDTSDTQSFGDLMFRRNEPSDPNGNNVTLEREMLEAVTVNRQHSRALAVYKSALTMMRSATSP